MGVSQARWAAAAPPASEVDVVVVGSGAAGLTAALAASAGGCSVAVLEKSERIGGASAISGGGVWVPRNAHMRDAGIEDTRDEALAYLRGLTDGREFDPELIEVYVDEAASAVGFLEAATPLELRFHHAFSDYYADRPGGKRAGRTLHPAPFGARAALGEWDELIHESPHFARITVDEWAAASDGPASDLLALAAERARSGTRTLGGALVACLLSGALEAGVAIHTATRVAGLVLAGGRVTGVRAARGEQRFTLAARRGVVLAAGGFEWSRELLRTFIGVAGLVPTSPPGNEGDGLVMALAAGADVANMTATWGYPVACDGRATFAGRPRPILRSPQREAGTIIVNRHGRRFTNEGVNYQDFPRALRHYDPVTHTYPNSPPVWEIFDQRVRERMVLGDLAPGAPTPDWVFEAATVGELAAAIGVDPDELLATVERFNAYAARGIDPDHGRGTVWFEGYLSGGPDPRAALAPIERPPFYATAVYEGIQGTAGGLRIDRHGRVLAMRGEAVPGLYAAGNTAASIFGPVYPAGGAIIGQAITFGYLAGRHLAAAA